MSAATHLSSLSLLRRWVVDYFNRHDEAAAREFVSADYTLDIGDVSLRGRDESWLPAVAAQMKLFPGLGMTVHQTLAGEDWAAAWFSEHGASKGRVACWSGVAIYFSDGKRLTRCVAQEDYMTRRRQLKTGLADRVEPPAAAPWDEVISARDSGAEDVVRDWLRGSWPSNLADVRCDDDHITLMPLQFDVVETTVDTVRSSGPHVAFHALQVGVYRGGLAGVERADAKIKLHVNGLVRVVDGRVKSGRVIRDRAGLHAALSRSAQR